MGWTPERVHKLNELRLKKLSASQISAELGGCTRNAVIGKLNRMGWAPGVEQVVKKRRVPEARKPYRKRAKPEPPPDPVEPTPLLVSLENLRSYHCRYPIGDNAPFQFCGRRTHWRCSYCEYHTRITSPAHEP